MLTVLKKYFIGDAQNSRAPEVKLRDKILIATCVLMLEVAKSDDEFATAEKEIIHRILEAELEIPKEDVMEIIKIAERNREESVDIFEYTNLINHHFSRTEKLQMVERFWEIIFADGNFDQFEDYTVHKLADLLRLTHEELIAAKLKVKPQQITNR